MSTLPEKGLGYKGDIARPHALTTPYRVVYMPAYMYTTMTKNKLFTIEESYECLSCEDIAFYIELNRKYNDSTLLPKHNIGEFSGSGIVDIDCLPSDYKPTIQFLLSTGNMASSVAAYMNEETDRTDLYKIVITDTDILVVVEPGMHTLLKNKEQNTLFLKELVRVSFNVMGEDNTHSQPFFKKLVRLL